MTVPASSETAGTSLFGSPEEVTSKLAYAYARAQLFVFSGGWLLAAGAALLLVQPGEAASVVGDVGLMAFGAALLLIAGGRADLGRVNRPCLQLALGAVLFRLAAFAIASFLRQSTGPESALTLGVLLAAALVPLSYPFPLRRGRRVLYPLTAVRELSNVRTAALASGMVAVIGGVLLGDPASRAGAAPWGLPALDWWAALVGIGTAGVLLYLSLPSGRTLERVGALLLGAALIPAILGIPGGPGDLAGWAASAPLVAAPLWALGVTRLLSPRLNRGRSIVGRRS